MPRPDNLFARVPRRLRRELFETLMRTPTVRIERIVSRGQRTRPGRWLRQARAEWVAVLRGRARLRFADEPTTRVLRVGDWVAIAPGRRHRVEATDRRRPTVWLAVHCAGGGDYIRKRVGRRRVTAGRARS